jgi:hypothetical protein
MLADGVNSFSSLEEIVHNHGKPNTIYRFRHFTNGEQAGIISLSRRLQDHSDHLHLAGKAHPICRERLQAVWLWLLVPKAAEVVSHYAL